MVKFIAEVSSNHHRDLSRAYEFINAAARSGCSAVKFQLFKVEQLFSPEILEHSEKHRKRKEWELPLEFVPKLAQHCTNQGIEFSCTPFYLDAVSELEPYVAFYKIASYELLWDDLLAACANTGKPVIISTGMATMSEIHHAVGVLKKNNCSDLTILHCTSAYPTPYEEANLAAIKTIHLATGCEVGWSDHTVEPAVIHRAIHHWGSRVIEFHLDLDGKGEEYKAGHCWLPDQIEEVILDVKKGFKADGTGIKEPAASELSDRSWRADPSDGMRPLKLIRKSFNLNKDIE
jgi:sialic acid synthase SpsE